MFKNYFYSCIHILHLASYIRNSIDERSWSMVGKYIIVIYNFEAKINHSIIMHSKDNSQLSIG